MLEVARAKAAAYEGSTKIEFDVLDAQAIPLPDESFDVVTVAFGVRNMPDRAANFREVFRVLRPGGRYVVLLVLVARNQFQTYLSVAHRRRHGGLGSRWSRT